MKSLRPIKEEEASMTNEDIKGGVATSNGDDDGDGNRDTNDDDDANHDDESTSSTPPSKKAKLPSLTKLLLLARPEFRALTFAFLLMIVSEGAGLYNPILLAQAYECVPVHVFEYHHNVAYLCTTCS